ncbi:MAG TPA: SpoIIE family protein phosphatase [Leptospiraceae bacterium]|nr:SpoIIE family protein phosphatase [Leptospiraceae bacterium]HMW06384.1 SpoIIE family protein phosphatase [Leptospiraceae bacterium]HMX31704.1 SpoIIE family protein phosphatase [Leptospiraceae bacterium]HMY31990.1 SpoIIE family protein phosphatase [Leptospiraceae bacterium]HMZ65797.1 SpoIIE family protein phosphatase [Leptospiraceae bacterium]
MKLRTKITFFTLSTVLTIFLLAMGINTFVFYSQAKESIQKEIHSSVSFFLSEINRATNTTEIFGKDLAQTGEIFYNTKIQEKPKDILPSVITDKMKGFSNITGGGIWYEPNLLGEKYFGLYGILRNGNVDITWEYSNDSYNYFKQNWYLQALPESWNRNTPRSEKYYRTTPYKDSLGNEQVIFITLCTIMYDKTKKIIGMSTIDWTLKSIKDLLSKLNITKSSFAVLIDRESKKILFFPNEIYLLKDYRELSWLKNNDFRNIQKGEISKESDIIIQDQVHSLYITETDARFILVIAVNEKEAYSLMIGIIIRNIILTIVTLLLTGVAVSFIVKRSLSPLMSIIDILRGIASGSKGLKERIQIQSKDEFGELAKTFNQMADTIDRQNLELKNYAETLEDKVKERTEELNRTLQEVTFLKNQQDGDYFLTSLLLKPLGRNRIQSETVKVDFLVKQKKEFVFKNKRNEIGGDLCATDSIQLANKTYSVFLNADAMGKSIQGAGGALILGSVFHAIIERTHSNFDTSQTSPERWLKNTFIELHKTFETFDGSMLVSMILGLVDESNGFCYIMNAEHPLAVLYREGKASFLETKSFYRKLGTPDAQGGIVIDTFLIRPGDILFLGSDGRDDISIGSDASGKKLINEDENLFLNIVENSNGDLNKIQEVLKSKGEVTDDLSLLRLEYTGKTHEVPELSDQEMDLVQSAIQEEKKGHNQKAMKILMEANNGNPNHPAILREMMRVYLNTKSFVKICEIGIPYIQERPEDLDMIYLVSFCLKRLKKYESALDYAERLKMREPNNTVYLIHLAEIYILLSNFSKAEHTINQLKNIDPENEKIFALEEEFEAKRG